MILVIWSAPVQFPWLVPNFTDITPGSGKLPKHIHVCGKTDAHDPQCGDKNP
jgi:hypothetical protein